MSSRLLHSLILGSVAQKVIGPHQWNVPVAHFTDDVLRVKAFSLVVLIKLTENLSCSLSLMSSTPQLS